MSNIDSRTSTSAQRRFKNTVHLYSVIARSQRPPATDIRQRGWHVGSGPEAVMPKADEAFTALNSGGRHVLPFSTRYPAFSLSDAYRVTALANDLRVAQRYKPLGRKIGF